MIKLAIVGATGLIGNTFLNVLEEKKLPIDEYTLFASSKSKDKKISFMDREYIVKELDENSFNEGFDYALFSAGSDVSLKFSPIAASKGCVVIDNSSAFRMEKDVPLVVPEVNIEDAYLNKGIIANPNCSTIQAVVVLKPLHDKYKIKRIVFSTYQAVSGAGQKGVSDLEDGEIGIPPSFFPHPIYSNCLPHIDKFLENGYTKEEMKMVNETHKILHDDSIRITSTTVRVPVYTSHSESINIEFENQYELKDVIQLLKNSPGIIIEDDISENIYPMAINAAGRDEVFVGRIRRDFSIENGLNLWVVADNTRKGAASNAIQILENLLYSTVINQHN
jgi:aspartate-semialdehyde dehydrogenase